MHKLECKEEKAKFESPKSRYRKLQDDNLGVKAQLRVCRNIVDRLGKDIDKKEKGIRELQI
jgi:hypothetical protein